MPKEFIYREKIKTFNNEQIAAANNFFGPVQIIAGPGSGKSTVLKVRSALMVMGEQIIKNQDGVNELVKSANKIAPENILLVTFTNKAANELSLDMKEYLNVELGSKIFVATFHSLANTILKENAAEFNIPHRLKIIQGEEQIKIIKLVNYYSFKDASEILSLIGLWKNELLINQAGYQKLHERYQNDLNMLNVLKVYQSYEAYKERKNIWDSDDLISRCINFLQNPRFALIKQKYQNLFKFISLDEYQDTNASQYTLSMLLKNDENNICVVGDPDQSIYEWRGADMKIIKRFSTEFKNTKEVLLLQNYRSQGNVIEASDYILQNNNQEKKVRGSIEQGKIINRKREKITIVNSSNEQEEARFVLRQIRKLVKTGIKLQDIAIFGRSIAHVKQIEDMISIDNEVSNLQSAYVITSCAKFYQNNDIQFIWSLVLLSLNPHQNKHMLNVLRLLKIEAEQLKSLEQYSILNDISVFSLIDNIYKYHNFENDVRFELICYHIKNLIRFGAKPTSTVSKIVSQIWFDMLDINQDVITNLFKYYKFFINRNNVELLKQFLQRLENLNVEHELYVDKFNFVEKNEQLQNYSVTFDPSKDYLNLMTMHASKGLEFEVVFCVHMNEELFPSKRSDNIEAERRLAFVAYTRAKQKLYLSTLDTLTMFGVKKQLPVSRFIRELFEPIKQVNLDPIYQKNMESFVKNVRENQIFNQIHFSTIPDLSWQEKLVVGDLIFHNKIGQIGQISALEDKHWIINFADTKLRIFKHNYNIIKYKGDNNGH